MKSNTVNQSELMLKRKKIALAVAFAIASSGSMSIWAQDKSTLADSKAPTTNNAVATEENDLLTLYRQAALSDPVFNFMNLILHQSA